MITFFKNKDIFKSSAECLVNPVNVVGVMGAGLALQFKTRYKLNYITYKEACDEGYIRIGCGLNVKEYDKYIFNFPTKKHWKDPSKLEYIELGLIDLAEHIFQFDINSVAIPALGCGLGGLDWNDVRPLIEKFEKKLNINVDIEIYEPN